MDFELSEEQSLIQRMARDYATRRLLPRAAERDLNETFPEAELRELAEMGLLGINVAEELGGAGAGAVAYSLVMQELARADASVAVAVSVTNMVAELVAKFGTPEQIATHIPQLLDGRYLCAAFALSEPGAGSDPASMTTTATKIDGGWRLRGTKQWITGGDRAGLLVVWALTEPESRGLSAFLVPGRRKGVVVNRAEEKMGLHGSSTVQLSFDDVELGDDALLGEVDGGFSLALAALDGGRIGISSQALGCAAFALEEATRYAMERVQFGVPIIEHQAIGNLLADCATWLDAGRLLTLRAAARKEQGLRYSRAASMAKLFSTEHAVKICDAAIQVHGGYGYTRDFPVERVYRDVRVTKIYEGTSEIQRIVIGRSLIKEWSQ